MSNFLKNTSGIPRGTAIAAGDLPTITLTSDVTGSGSGGSVATTVAKIQGTSVTGTSGSGNVVFATSPTMSGATLNSTTTFNNLSSNSINAATTGKINFSNGNTIAWRNSGNSADILLLPDADGILKYGNIDIVNLSATQTLSNKTLTGNTAVNLVSGSGTLSLNTSGTITVPNASDTLVGKATTDTLTNKTLTGNTAVNLISGSGTLTLNTTGTVTLPNATDTLVGKATTDTLTNKTISGSSNTLSNIANASLTSSSVTVGSTSISLGATAATISGLTLASAANTGTTTFPGTSSIDSSGNATFGGNLVAKGSPSAFGTTSSATGFIVTIQSSTSGGANFGGLQVNCGTTLSNEFPLVVGNAANNLNYLVVAGNKSVVTANNTLDNGSTGAASFAGNVTVKSLVDSGYQYVSTTGNFTINNTTWHVIVNAGTQTTLTVTMPSTPADGQLVTISFVGAITTATVQANSGQTVDGGSLGTLGINTFASWIYKSSNLTWFRCG